VQVEDKEIDSPEAFKKAVKGFGKIRLYIYGQDSIVVVAL